SHLPTTQLPVIGCCLCHGHLDWPLPSWCVCVCVCFGVCVGGWVDRIRLVWVHVNIGVCVVCLCESVLLYNAPVKVKRTPAAGSSVIPPPSPTPLLWLSPLEHMRYST